MANVNIEQWRRYVEPFATGVTVDERLLATQEVLRDFCERTRCWQVLLDAIPTVIGTASYTLTPPTGAAIHQVEEVFLANDYITFSGLDDLRTKETQQNWRTLGNGISRFVSFLEPGIMRLSPPPDSVGYLYVRASLMPDIMGALVSSEVPDFLYRQWAAQIADGILARLYYTPDMPYSSANRGDAKSIRYEQHVAAARMRVARSFGRKFLETTPVYY